MERHGEALARAHQLRPGRRLGPRGDRLLARLTENEGVLVATGELLTAARHRRPADHAGRRMAARQLLPDRRADPHRASGTCPRATAASCRAWPTGPSAGLPRVYDIALEAISHGDGRVDAESLRRFVAAYQSGRRRSTLGELWAIPIMLRLALIENLRRVARAHRRQHRRAQPGRRLGRPHDRDRRARSEEPDPRHRRHGALEPADDQRLRRRARAPPAGPERRRSRCRSPGSSSAWPSPA